MIGIITAVFSSSVISTLLTLAGGYFIVNKRAADYANKLEKKKKIAEIYYEERSKVLQELYALLVNRPSDIINLMRFLGKIANGERWANPTPYLALYEELENNEDQLKKVLLKSSLYLKNDDYKTIKEVRDDWGEPVKHIVDLFILYENIPNKHDVMFNHSDEFEEFSNQTLEVHKLNLLFDKYVKKSENFGDIAEILKKAIASEEIQ